MLLQFIHMGFHPLDRTQQAGLLSIPRAIDDGALWRPALAMEFAQHARFLQHGGLAGNRIVGAVHPGIVMIAAQHPIAASIRAGQRGDDVVERLDVPVGSNFEVHLGGPGPDVISDGQRAAPTLRSDRTMQRREQRKRVGIGNRKHGNFCDRLRFFDGEPLGVRGRSHTRRQRIAGIVGVHHAAALHALSRPPASVRIIVAVEITVAFRVGINDAAHRSVLAGDFGLDAAPARSVAGNHDRALDRNSQAIELLVVFAIAVVHVHQRSGHVSIDGIGVVGRKLLSGLAARGIDRPAPAPAAWPEIWSAAAFQPRELSESETER